MTISAGKSALIWIAVIVGAVLVLGVMSFGFLWWMGSGLCGNTEAFERASPTGAYRAVVFDRDCGATTPFSTQISVLKRTEKLKDAEAGNCVVFKRETSGIEFEWKSDTDLVIELAGQPLTKDDQCGGVHVTYRIRQ